MLNVQIQDKEAREIKSANEYAWVLEAAHEATYRCSHMMASLSDVPIKRIVFKPWNDLYSALIWVTLPAEHSEQHVYP